MGNDFEGYLDYHHRQHRSPFNVLCVAVGDLLLAAWLPLLLVRSTRKLGAVTFGLGSLTVVAGHVVDGTLAPEVRGVTRHPVWHVRADLDLLRTRLFT